MAVAHCQETLGVPRVERPFRVEERPLQPRTIDLRSFKSRLIWKRLILSALVGGLFVWKLAGAEAERTASIRPPGQGIADLFLTDRSRADNGFRERITYNVTMGTT
jgi:hypothetical protein